MFSSTIESFKLSHNRYIKTNTILGKGSYGTVSKGIDKKTGKIVAIKEIDKKFSKIKDLTMKEKEILTSLDHQNIVKILHFEENQEKFIIVTEYCSEGTINEFYEKEFGDDLESRKTASKIYFEQVLKGILYLHSMGVFHRDLKPTNILVHCGTVKIADFGCSRNFDCTVIQASTYKGTYAYSSPEFISSTLHDVEIFPKAVDIWSVGVSFLELVLGNYPFPTDGNLRKYITRLKKVNIPKSIKDSNLINLLQGCLNVDPKQRLSAYKLLESKFFPQIDRKVDVDPKVLVKELKTRNKKLMVKLEELNKEKFGGKWNKLKMELYERTFKEIENFEVGNEKRPYFVRNSFIEVEENSSMKFSVVKRIHNIPCFRICPFCLIIVLRYDNYGCKFTYCVKCGRQFCQICCRAYVQYEQSSCSWVCGEPYEPCSSSNHPEVDHYIFPMQTIHNHEFWYVGKNGKKSQEDMDILNEGIKKYHEISIKKWVYKLSKQIFDKKKSLVKNRKVIDRIRIIHRNTLEEKSLFNVSITICNKDMLGKCGRLFNKPASSLLLKLTQNVYISIDSKYTLMNYISEYQPIGDVKIIVYILSKG